MPASTFLTHFSSDRFHNLIEENKNINKEMFLSCLLFQTTHAEIWRELVETSASISLHTGETSLESSIYPALFASIYPTILLLIQLSFHPFIHRFIQGEKDKEENEHNLEDFISMEPGEGRFGEVWDHSPSFTNDI